MGAMASANQEAAALLREYAELLGLTGGDPFRARNYERAAKSVAGYPADLAALPDKALTAIDGVGPSIAAKIAECRRTGTFQALEELRAKIPPGVAQLAKVPGVGPKRALQLVRELGITSAAELAEAIRRGRLRGVAGFGPKTEERILRGIDVAAGDAALRDALRALPDGAGVDDIYAVLAAQLPASAAADSRQPGGRRADPDRGHPRRPAHAYRPHRRHRPARRACSPPRSSAATRTTRSPTTRRTWSCSG